MTSMLRALALAALVLALPGAAAFQAPPGLSVLHIKVSVADAGQTAVPVPRHALLISDNPATTTPRRVVTGADGAIDVRLRPGNYTVESDTPFSFQGKSYEWRQTLDVRAGRDAVLELTARNAEIGSAPAAPAAQDSAAPVEGGISSLLIQWQDSVVALWTPTTHASAFVIDVAGLLATNQRVIGAAASVEVQLAPDLKVAASVLASDPVKDVAILRIDPAAAASVKPVPLGCAQAAGVKEGQEVFTIGAPLRMPKGPAFAGVTRVDPHSIETDFVLPGGSAGGPAFVSGSTVIGLTSIEDDKDEHRRGSARVVPIADVCSVLAVAQAKLKTTAAPSGTRLPVEPSASIPPDALKDAALRRVGNLNPYQMTSADFDVAFITPVMIYGAQYLNEQMSARDRGGRGGRSIDAGQPVVRPQLEFGNWSEYTADLPQVLLVRVTPKLVEGFWTKVARGAAQTQGVPLPPFKRIRSGFGRMRVLCGDAEITPIHPFKIEQHVSDSETVYEGLYVFDPGAFAPSCSSVKLVLSGEKEPERSDTRVVDPKMVQQIWQDFDAYRSAAAQK